MQRRGNTIREDGPYKIVELVEIYADGTREVLGYNLIGPESDGSWLHDLAQAHTKLEELLAKHRPSSPRP